MAKPSRPSPVAPKAALFGLRELIAMGVDASRMAAEMAVEALAPGAILASQPRTRPLGGVVVSAAKHPNTFSLP